MVSFVMLLTKCRYTPPRYVHQKVSRIWP